MSRSSLRKALFAASASLVALSCASLILVQVSPAEPDALVAAEPMAEHRFVAYLNQPDEIREGGPPPTQESSDEEAEDSGVRHKREEAWMGKPTSKHKSGLYALKSPKDAIPQMARKKKESRPRALPGGVAGGARDKNAWGGLTGTEIGSAYGAGGMAFAGKSRGAPGKHMNMEVPTAEDYGRIVDNKLKKVADDPRSTFSIDVDTASYSNTRRFLNEGRLPPPDAVRIEELINYFDYEYEPPTGDVPFSITSEVGPCPWNPERRLAHIGLQGKVIADDDLPPRNLVFLLDVSGSMDTPSKLPLVKRALTFLTESLDEDDRVSIVVYAGAAGLVLPPTSGNDRRAIMESLDRLSAGGSTNGGEGIHLAYGMARDSFVDGGINRVILATDGDFNVGTTSRADLERLIEDKRKSGVFLSVLGFGMGNLKDATMEQLADKGNGNYAYIDSVAEARKVLVEQAGATLVTIAKDVKIQTEFNPRHVSAYRLVGYVNRMLAHRDFNDDTKDAGEIGAGHTVTALYEIVPAGRVATEPGVDPLRYQSTPELSAAAKSGELMTVKLRYKEPDGERSKLLEVQVEDGPRSLDETSNDFRFSAAVAGFGMLLRKSENAHTDYARVMELAWGSRGADPHCYRGEFLTLVGKAAQISGAGDLGISDRPVCTPAPPAKSGPSRVTHDLSLDLPTPATILEGLLQFLRGLPTFLHFIPGLLALPLVLIAARWPAPRS
jgi:Ca-activated chloride channel family protein